MELIENEHPEITLPCMGMVTSYMEFQRVVIKSFPGKSLNAASGGDPADLGSLGSINLDVQSFEPSTGLRFENTKNYVNGSVLNIPFSPCEFDTVILGELLEHCTKERAIQVIKECSRVLVRGGVLGITVPLDGLAFVRRCKDPTWKDPRGDYVDGISHEHQSWWLDEDLAEFRAAGGFAEIHRSGIYYFGLYPMGGWGLVWRRI